MTAEPVHGKRSRSLAQQQQQPSLLLLSVFKHALVTVRAGTIDLEIQAAVSVCATAFAPAIACKVATATFGAFELATLPVALAIVLSACWAIAVTVVTTTIFALAH